MSERQTYLIRLSGDLSTKKGRAYARFRRRLALNIRDAMKSHGIGFSLRLARNRFYLSADEGAGPVLGRIFGIQSVSPEESVEWNDLDDLLRVGEEKFRDLVRDKSFAVRVRRNRIRDQVTWRSVDLERELGTRLLEHAASVNLSSPDVTVRMELDPTVVHLFHDVAKGSAGLPVGSGGRVLSLVSGGIDSAVASWLMLKRGVAIDYLFYNLGGSEHESQVLEVIQVLARDWSYGDRPTLWLVDLRPQVEELRERTPERLWQVVLKRIMLRGAHEIAARTGAGAVLTGEALGQVSSQTLENLNVIAAASPSAVLRPLLGFDKSEIIALARRIGTFELSAKVPEYCALQGRSPATTSTVDELEEAERDLDLEAFTTSLLDSPSIDLRTFEAASQRRENGPLATTAIPEGAEVIDLRSKSAFSSWHYPGALRLDFGAALAACPHFDQKRVYVVCCEVEFKSAHLAERLRAGGRQAHYFAGGTSRLMEWAAEQRLLDPASIAPAARS